jgi:hypothetical protein
MNKTKRARAAKATQPFENRYNQLERRVNMGGF